MTNRTEQQILKDLKQWWGVVKDQKASPDDKSIAKKKINALQLELKEQKPETKVTDWEAQEAAYQASKSSPRSETASTAFSTPMTEATEYKFEVLSSEEQKEVTNKAIRLFEQKIIVQQVASRYKNQQFDNGASVGQILTLINQ